MFGIGLVELIIFCIFILYIPVVLYILSIKKVLFLCTEESREMSPSLAWLLLIPIFGLIWHFFVVSNIAKCHKSIA